MMAVSAKEARTESVFPLTEASPNPRRKRPRLGFAGVGWIGLHRMQALLQPGLAEAAAIFDPEHECARRAHEIAPAAEIVSSFERLLDQDLDGLVIATPTAFHSEQTIAALERGFSVFCQKPLGRNGRETELAISAARRANKLLKVDLSYRFLDGAKQIRELIQRGALGDVFFLDIAFHNAYGPDKPWFYNPRLSGGGCLIDLGVHLVDLALWFCDFPSVAEISGRLFAKGNHFSRGSAQVEDFADVALTTCSGLRIHLSCSWKLHAGQDALIRASVYGTEGGAALRNLNGSFYDFTAEHNVGTSRQVLSTPPEEWGGRAAAAWLTRLCNDDSFDPAVEQLAAVADVLDRIYDL